MIGLGMGLKLGIKSGLVEAASTETYVVANCLSLDAYEANSITGIAINPSDDGEATISVETINTDGSTYAVKIENVSGLTDILFTVLVGPITVENGATYTVTCRGMVPTGSSGNWNFILPNTEGWAATSNFNLGPAARDVWQSISYTGKVTNSTSVYVHLQGRAGNDDGDICYFDKLSIVKTS